MQLNVHILTTAGVASVERLTPQDSRLRSVVCERGTFNPLPISPDYHHFVSAPSGVVQQYFGDHSYRIEISLPISHGTSWQLGLLVAHWLHHHSRLNFKIDGSHEHHLLLSGQIDADLNVLPVQHTESKIQLALDWIASQSIALEACTLVLPKGSIIPPDLPAQLKCILVSHLENLAPLIDLPTPRTDDSNTRSIRYRTAFIPNPRFWVPLLLCALFGVWLFGSTAPTWRELSTLESQGQYRQLLTELRRLKDSRNLLHINTAAIFEEKLRQQAEHIDATHPLSLHISEPSPNCPQTHYALDIPWIIPSHLYRNCEPLLEVRNTEASASVVWIYTAHRAASQLLLLAPEQSTMTQISDALKPSELIIVSAKRPISDILSWLDTLQVPEMRDAEVVDRFRRAGISIRIVELPGTSR